jgi:predicted neuraminidase
VKILVALISACLYLIFHNDLGIEDLSAYRLPENTLYEGTPFFEQHWVSFSETAETHSASIAMLNSEIPAAVWYGGTEEGHSDVALFLSIFDGAWSEPKVIADRASTENGLSRYIRKIGNPTLHVWPDGNIGVFYVSVSIGGWGGSSVNYIESSDTGVTWSKPRRLVTSPFLNISTLVRTNALELENGHIELPIYHEFVGKFSESLLVSREIEVIDKRRISWGLDSLQPAIMPLDETSALALLRYSGDPPGRIWSSLTSNSGRNWTTPELTPLPNPNAAIALLNTGDGNLLLAFNDAVDGRNRLSLATRSASEGTWKRRKVVETETNTIDVEYEFSYPSLTKGKGDNIHLVYTWNQKRIKHIQFNLAWLNKAKHSTL